MSTSHPTTNPSAPLGGARFLTANEVMPMLGYSDRSAFWQGIKTAGLPYIKLNARTCRFEESAVRAWLDSHTVGNDPRDGGAI